MNQPACAECGRPTIPGLNTDFCSQACEETWTAAHTWPCACSSVTRDESGFCRNCGETGEYVDHDRRHCSTDGCKSEARAGQDFCGKCIAGIYAVSTGKGHCHGR